MAQSQDLIVTKTGEVRGINSPLVAKIADALGTSEIMRASHVDPTNELSDAALAWLLANRPEVIREVPTIGYLNDTPRAAMIRQLPATWWADMLPVGGPVLGQFPSYDAARDAEIVWLREHNIPVCTSCATPPK